MNVQINEFCMPDPRKDGTVGVVPFYFPGKPCPWDSLCSSGFLGNFWEVDEGIHFAVPGKDPTTFSNSEAAFQACKFWDRAAEFAPLSGEGAFRLKMSLRGEEDWTYGGFGSNWLAMQAVLAAKFQPESAMASVLLQTGDAYLLEHNAVEGRDKVWSDNLKGDGSNWLGLQLMLLRDALNSVGKNDVEKPWTQYAGSLLDLASGAPKDPKGEEEWQATVLAAAKTVLERYPCES
eukprot:gnl/MRDRNA2_/MRDRNA2_110811_c0_seq1.p1 gnl/MRDRNA2_/MRDRNA2_110811_c0~~gnl/MRDRNA2_/MRDRNA2_110811_c0_seq1.p1  ORF type:complete len:234 (-),score=45.30 gnl/MRDRNA2_/MRDRNA2_110811_c0_seq1:82-783(-)